MGVDKSWAGKGTLLCQADFAAAGYNSSVSSWPKQPTETNLTKKHARALKRERSTRSAKDHSLPTNNSELLGNGPILLQHLSLHKAKALGQPLADGSFRK